MGRSQPKGEIMEQCQRCKEVDEDRRSLWMACFYEMDELHLPFDKKKMKDADETLYQFYTLRVCKNCRSDWMKSIQCWFHDVEPQTKSCGSGIFVREFGANVEITEEEWYRRNPEKHPIRFIGIGDDE